MSRKYLNLVVLKTNKPNSKKVIGEFINEFGYVDYTDENLDFDKRAIGITIPSEDILYEVENFSKKRDEKFTLSFVKIERNNPSVVHVLKKNEFVNGEMTLEEKDDTKRILIEKEEKALYEKRLKNSKYKKPQHHNKNKHQHKHKPKQQNHNGRTQQQNHNGRTQQQNPNQSQNNQNKESPQNQDTNKRTNNRNHLRKRARP